MKPTEGVTAEIVVQHVRALIERGELRPGDRLPPERELAVQLGVSRPSVRAGLRSLAAIGVLQTRHGAGTFITDGPPTLGSEPLSFLAALHGFTRDEMFEARRALEVGVAAQEVLAARGQHEGERQRPRRFRLPPPGMRAEILLPALDQPEAARAHCCARFGVAVEGRQQGRHQRPFSTSGDEAR